MKHSVIDFETFYDKEISVVKLGNPNYAKKSDAYIVSCSVDGEAHCGTIKEMGPMMENLAKDDTVVPVAANSNFDQTWWEKYWPAFKNNWHCVLDQSVFHQFPRSLPGSAKVVLGVDVDKTTRDAMKGIHYENLSPEEQENVQRYCLNDTLTEHDLLVHMPAMSAFEEKVAQHTRMMNRRGVKINMDLVESSKTKIEAMRFDAFKRIPWHADFPPLSYPALVRYCAAKGLPVPKNLSKADEDTTEIITDNPELKLVVDQMRRFRKANTILKKIGTLLDRVTDEDVLPMDILYCGAPHTRRWSSKGFNVQNLDKEPMVTLGEKPADVSWDEILNGEKKIEGLEYIWSRNWLIPRPGHVFLILDFAQIEPRCLNWLVGNDEMMAALRNGFSYYESYAASAKNWKGAPGTLKKEFGIARYTKLKNESLGCGYGMGPAKYQTYAHVDEAEAKAIVTGFRRTNPKVVKFWHKLDGLIRTAARDKSKHLSIEMPTGDVLQHFSIRSNQGNYVSFTTKNDFTHNSMQPRLWGGTLTENVTQRMARDVMANAILNLEAGGLPVIFHSHDEMILEVPIESKEEARQEAYRILTTSPEWANDLPLAVEGDFADAYTK